MIECSASRLGPTSDVSVRNSVFGRSTWNSLPIVRGDFLVPLRRVGLYITRREGINRPRLGHFGLEAFNTFPRSGFNHDYALSLSDLVGSCDEPTLPEIPLDGTSLGRSPIRFCTRGWGS